MNLTKETIEKAVNWWVEKVTANQPHSNGDNGYTSIVTCLLADSMVKKISKKQVEVFKKELAMRIEEEAKAWTEISIGCDYGPCVMLEQAALEAGIPATNFPFKTWMYISEKDGIEVHDGYGDSVPACRSLLPAGLLQPPYEQPGVAFPSGPLSEFAGPP